MLAHERAHLRARHDLILEFFTVVHEAVPAFVRSDAALREVTLLIEVLADRAAVRATSVLATARDRRDGHRGQARGHPGHGGFALGCAPAPRPAHPRPSRRNAASRSGDLMYLFAASIVTMPVALLVVAWASG